jgi:phosphopantothenoylcysteine decarboxylase/phosphopantothenate--cysteine ligase
MGKILLGVTGGIACYKAVYLLRLLKKLRYDVRVVMTESACRFVGHVTFETLSGSPVYMADSRGAPIDHIELASWADLIVIAPATANTIAKLANGLADNLLTALCLAARSKIMVFPAMNSVMYQNPATKANMDTLTARGFYVAEAETGELACDETGTGRLTEPEDIAQRIQLFLTRSKPLLAGKNVLVTAGPTVEEIDSVRYISNYSSGKMGFAVAEAAQAMGAEVLLVSGPVSLIPPVKNIVRVKSASDMLKTVKEKAESADILIMTAAVADYAPSNAYNGKIKKSADRFSIELVKTADVIKEAAERKRPDQFFAGFAAESENPEENALVKLKEKALDLIVLNDISKPGIGFNSDDNEVTLFFADGGKFHMDKQPKRELAYEILQKIAEKLKDE